METIERTINPPLARRLGDTLHVSPLLRKVCQMSGCSEERVGEWLLKCAVGRGASHYERDFPAGLPPDHPELSDEELGVALSLGQHPYNSTYIRAAAQLLSSPTIDATRLARLAVMERVEPVLLYIATVAARFAPDTQPWASLLLHLPQRLACPPDALPHWSRFVSQTGVMAPGGGSGYQMASPAQHRRMSNPLRILGTVDRHLTLPAEITLFGRSSLALGYSPTPAHFHNTKNVDGILPLSWLLPPEGHEDFWRAVQDANTELEPEGLYLTHLFREVDVILQPDWFSRRVRIEVDLKKLVVFRPATIDLILTKMARADDDDLQDIQFLIRAESLTREQLEAAFAGARVPEAPEIQELFGRARPKVPALV